MHTSIVCRLAFVGIWICAPLGGEVWGQESPFEEPIKKSETGSNDAALRPYISDRNFREQYRKLDKRGQNPPGTNSEINEKRETISDRIFQIRPSKSTEPIDMAGRTRQWIILDHLSPGLDDLEPGDIVDLLLPSDASEETLDSDETYIPKFKPLIEHVRIAEIQWPDTRKPVTSNNRRVMGPALCAYLNTTEVLRIQREGDLGGLGRYPITHVVRLKHGNAEKLAERLNMSFKSAGIEATVDQNAIVIEWVSAWPIQGLIEIENAIKKLDVPRSRPAANVDPLVTSQPNAVAAEPHSTQNGYTLSGESAKVNLTRAIPDTPAARNLVEQLRSHESTATALAAEIRQLLANGQASQNQSSVTELKLKRQKLQNVLESAFDLKLQLEEIQVKELQSRLSQHQQQIGQRKALRAKIIARRASDLVEGNALKWNPKPEATTGNKDVSPMQYPDPGDLYIHLEPILRRIKSAKNQVEELETIDTPDRSKAAELQTANSEVTKAEDELRKRWNAIKTTVDPRLSETTIIKAIQEDLSERYQEIIEDLLIGKDAETNPLNARVTTPRWNDRGSIDRKIIGIQMSGPEGLVMSMEGQRFNIGSKHFSFGISRAIDDPLDLHFEYKPVLHAAVLAGRLDLYPADKYSFNFLRDNVIPIEITEDDIRAAWNSGLIKVIYLPDAEPGEPAPLAVETIVTSSAEDIEDPFQEADRLGTILLVLRLAKNQDELPFAKVSPGQITGGPGSIGPNGRSQISNGNTGLAESDREKNVLPTQFPSPDEFRIQLEPFSKRLQAAKEKVRKLETIYFQDRSNAAELQTAIDEINKAKDEVRERWNGIKPVIDQCESDLNFSNGMRYALEKRAETKLEKLSQGDATEGEVSKEMAAFNRAKETVTANETRHKSYLKLIEDDQLKFLNGSSNTPIGDYPEATSPETSFPADVAMIWIEAAMGLKLRFVRFDDLKLPFKAALRVREPKGQYKTGDLIVVLHGRQFESLDQVVTLLITDNSNAMDSTVLSGGIAGTELKVSIYHNLARQYLQPATIDQAGVYLELRIKGPEQNDVLIDYFNGTCVSPDGLVVVPIWSTAIVEGEPIRAFGNTFRKTTARVVASDDERGLTLLMLEFSQRNLVPWVKCRTGQPAMGQRLTGLEIFFSSSEDWNTRNCSVTLMELNQKYASKRVGNDGFVISASPSFSARIGSPLTAIDGELQGIVVDSEDEESTLSPAEPLRKRVTAIPAVHIQKLIDEYRKQESKP